MLSFKLCACLNESIYGDSSLMELEMVWLSVVTSHLPRKTIKEALPFSVLETFLCRLFSDLIYV